ncbi:MAG TPA: hypothetical protein VIO61_04860 [Anaerolineaceae bacterium]
MVNSIQDFSPMQAAGMRRQMNVLTDEDKQKIQDILAQYDPENVSAEDAKAIFKAFRDAGIRPGAGMKEAIEAAGFDAEALRAQGMPEPPPPPEGRGGMHGSKGINFSALSSLKNILEQNDLTSLTTDQESELLNKLDEAGLLNPGYMIDMKS